MRRWYFHTILEKLDQKQFTLIAGPRQSGKTTTLKQIEEYFREKNIPCSYIDLENIRIRSAVNEDPDNLLHYTDFPGLKNEERYFVLLDEVQNASDPSHLLKYLYDTYHPKLKIIATGSSSFYIDQKFTDSLVGRKRLITTSTLSFEEFLAYTQSEDLEQELHALQTNPKRKSTQRPQLIHALEEYLKYGGYPEVVLAKSHEEKLEILDDIALSMIQKDLIESGISDELNYHRLLRTLAFENGQLLNVHSLSHDLKLKRQLIESMIYIARKSLLISTLSPFHKNFRKELSKMPKLYFLDTGLRNYLANDFRVLGDRQDKGVLLENYLYCSLWRKYDPLQIHFWRTADAYEVDFVIESRKNSGQAYEVKWNCKQKMSKGQHHFIDHYKLFPLQKVCFTGAGPAEIDILNFNPANQMKTSG